MQVRVEYFGIIGDLSRRKEEDITIEAGSTVASALESLSNANPYFSTIASQVRVVVNGQAATRETVLHDGDQLALMKAIGGGSDFGQQQGRAF